MGYAEKFRRYLVEDGKSPSTITSYVGDVEGFCVIWSTRAASLTDS